MALIEAALIEALLRIYGCLVGVVGLNLGVALVRVVSLLHIGLLAIGWHHVWLLAIGGHHVWLLAVGRRHVKLLVLGRRHNWLRGIDGRLGWI